MRPRIRAVILLATIVLGVAGLLAAGPAHLGLHAQADGPGCDACAMSGAAPPQAIPPVGPVRLARIEPNPTPSPELAVPLHLLPPPRGPPRIV